ncbi:ubiquinone biosynthesis protein COQ7-domain-containing protein [Terfezia claveryi]|nr:ubiquinone biosynthesis protein COQ7-domain-containing protein [Terfezia claveryi]
MSIGFLKKKDWGGGVTYYCTKCFICFNLSAMIPVLSLNNQMRLESTYYARYEQEMKLVNFGANFNYSGQYAVLKHDRRLKPLIRHMWDQELHHLNTFSTYPCQIYHPTDCYVPTVEYRGVCGGSGAMACTETVETEIGTHYNGQVRVLLEILRDLELNDSVKRGEVDGELNGLLEILGNLGTMNWSR